MNNTQKKLAKLSLPELNEYMNECMRKSDFFGLMECRIAEIAIKKRNMQ